MYTILGSDQQQYGPVDEATVIQWIQSGQANAATMIHKEGAAEWAALATFPEFAAALSAAPPPVIQPPMVEATQEGEKLLRQVGILNIVVGVLCIGLNGVALVGLQAMVAKGKVEVAVLGWVLMGIVLLAGFMAIISGIGLLMRRNWGRILGLAFGITLVLTNITTMIMNVMGAMENAPTGDAQETGRLAGQAIGRQMCSLFFQLIIAAANIMYLNRKNVRQLLR